jgi:hypothetical protein
MYILGRNLLFIHDSLIMKMIGYRLDTKWAVSEEYCVGYKMGSI